jgi:hypothetical protein
MGSSNPSYRSFKPQPQGRLGQQELPTHRFDFVNSITGGVKQFAYVIIDALKGRYDR